MPNDKQEIYYSIILVCLFVFVLVTIIIVTGILYYNRKRKYQQERAKFQQELLNAQLEIQEETLNNISQEIHDNIGQTLSLAKLNLNIIKSVEQDSLFEKVDSAKDLVSKAIHDLRSLAKTLNTDNILYNGLANAIAILLQTLEKSEAFRTKLEIYGTSMRFDQKKEIILFRIIQEAINNAIKHSGASEINITVFFNEYEVVLVIQDNGCGFEVTSESDLNSGSGLKNMHSRAKLIQGNFNLQSAPSKGTIIKLTVPVP